MPLPAEVYARIFDGTPEGQQILEELEAIYCTKLFYAGGEEGRRRTDFALGSFAVVEFIKAKISLAHGAPADPGEDGENLV